MIHVCGKKFIIVVNAHMDCRPKVGKAKENWKGVNDARKWISWRPSWLTNDGRRRRRRFFRGATPGVGPSLVKGRAKGEGGGCLALSPRKIPQRKLKLRPAAVAYLCMKP